MAVNYVQNAIGSAAFSAVAANRGACKTLSSAELSDLTGDVDQVLAACVANTTISGLGTSTQGSAVVQAIRAAVEAAVNGVDVHGYTSGDQVLIDLATQIATLYTACTTAIGGNPTINCIASAAFSSLAVGRGAGMALSTTVLVDLVADVTVVITACHANATLLALEGSLTVGSQGVQALRAAVESALEDVSVHGFTSTSTTMVALATQIAALYTASSAHMGANAAMYSIGSSAFSALSKKRGASATLSTGEMTALTGDVDAVLLACHNNGTISTLEGTATAGSPQVQALRAGVESAVNDIDIHGFVGTDPEMVALATQIVALYTASLAHMGSTS